MNEPTGVEVTEKRLWFVKSLVTWDENARAGYLTVCPDAATFQGIPGCFHRVDKTVDLGNGVSIDVDADGHIYGIETLGREVCMSDLILALRWYQEADRS